MRKENVTVGNKKRVVIPEFARPARTRGSSTHLSLRNETTNDKRGRFPIETLGNDALFLRQVSPDLQTFNAALYPGLQISGMTNRAECGFPSPLAGEGARRAGEGYKKAFTLIELLVVVLIIGILAAVALPQYQFAVDKSRVMGYVQNIQQLVKAQQIYKMASGEYQPDFTALDIDLTKICRTNSGACHNELYNCPGGFGININAEGGNPCHVSVSNDGDEPWVALSYCPDGTACGSGSSSTRIMGAFFQLKDGVLTSCTFNNTSRGQKLCKWLQQQFQ